jgi:hypothetical protein
MDRGVPRLPVAEREAPVHGLRSREVAVEQVGRPPHQDRRLEDAWQGKPRHFWRWWIWTAIGTTILIAGSVATVVALNATRQAASTHVSPLSGFEIEKVELDERFALFQEDPIRLQAEAARLLADYAAATSPEQLLPLVRGQATVAGPLRTTWQPWPAPPHLDGRKALQFAYTDNLKPPFLVVFGKRSDQIPFRAYFVREGEHLKLDWEATEGICDIPIHELPGATGVRQALVRCEVEAKPFHTTAFPETRFRSFLLSTADQQAWIWGYGERDGETELRLKALLDTGSAFLEQKTRERATLRITADPGRDLPNQFLITEMLHIDWVRP